MTDTVLIPRQTNIPLWIYAIACFLPVFKADDIPGISALLMGWVGVFGHWPVFFSWLANIFFFAAYLIPSKKKQKELYSLCCRYYVD